jgi:hypothetical protein
MNLKKILLLVSTIGTVLMLFSMNIVSLECVKNQTTSVEHY